MNNHHIPVLLQEVLEGMNLKPGDHCMDGTVGGGGHTQAILERISPDGIVIGFDRDADTLLHTTERLNALVGDRFRPIHDSYANVAGHIHKFEDVAPFDSILVDLGFSSIQIDDADRGFSFQSSGPLDMRYDRTQGACAADLLNSQPEVELRRIFREYGEVRGAARLARAIVQDRTDRPFTTTSEFAQFVERILGRRQGRRIHPATRVFQALRIAVNNELDHVHRFLPIALEQLKPGGRLAVISFHSLEDRMVKQFFRTAATECICPPEIPECRCDHVATINLITRKPIVPSEEEVAQNPRSRSAKLRIVEKR